MTCIVGLEYDNIVYIGGDNQGTGGNHKIVHTQPKVFKKGSVIFGFTSSYRFGQLLENALPNPVVPEKEEEIYYWLCSVLIPDIKKVLKENECPAGNCLIGIRSQLWELQTDFSVLRAIRGYNAVGSGAEYALGSLFTGNDTLKPTVLIATAIKAAAAFSPSVGADSTILHT